MEEIQFFLDEAKEDMEKALRHIDNELTKIRAGKAMPNMVESVMVDYYGTPTAISQVASVNTPDARTLAIKPWEKAMVAVIDKAIRESNLGFNPQNDGEIVRINVPPLTEERRKVLVKQAKSEGEDGKVRVRSIRKDTNESLRKLLKDGASEDAVKTAEDKVQVLTDSYILKVDSLIAKKETELLTV
ncbi:MAG: frr [Chitinophagaceae bacterium]|nr:frr [Chitinophagaceae bacterium]